MKKHKIKQETRQRAISVTVCEQPGCKWFSREAQQGVCYTNEGELAEFAKLDAHERQLTSELAEMKKREGKQYIVVLEANYITAMMNWQCTLDECIRLRRDNAVLRLKNGKVK